MNKMLVTPLGNLFFFNKKSVKGFSNENINDNYQSPDQ